MEFIKWLRRIEEQAERLLLIKQLFGYDKFLGEDIKQLKTNRHYYGDYFDVLYDMEIEELRRLDESIGNEAARYQSYVNFYATNQQE